jgi:LacI family sucrose operon transcriptional repressor
VRKTKRVTIKDIAELAGVSKATASLVLNGRSKELRVAEETRERVLAIAKEHHYQPSIHARSLRDNRSHTIGLVVPEITNYGFAVFSHELETLCREAGVQLLISCSVIAVFIELFLGIAFLLSNSVGKKHATGKPGRVKDK